jgi:hypothetical protein
MAAHHLHNNSSTVALLNSNMELLQAKAHPANTAVLHRQRAAQETLQATNAN